MLKPSWLDKKLNLNSCRSLKEMLRDTGLHTVCEEALCPNISECFAKKTATFMILGDACTRECAFCGVAKAKPKIPDKDEPRRLKEAVKKLGLEYVVITSPTRDDLLLGGAEVFCETVKEVLSIGRHIQVEILIPDFYGNPLSLRKVALCGAKVIAHNLETVPSLYIQVRKGADYSRSLEVLRLIKELNSKVFTKSGLMLGLGEQKEEIVQVMRDLRKVACDFLTLGQYLPPSLTHYPLKEYISPEKFAYFKITALKLGFKGVKSSPYVRSSYLAHSFLT